MEIILFIPQRIHRIGGGCFDGLVADGEQSDTESRQAGKYENPDTQPDPVGEVLQPSVHEIIRGWPGYDIGQEHPF